MVSTGGGRRQVVEGRRVVRRGTWDRGGTWHLDTTTCKEWKSLYIWSPPLVIADVALEECMKAIHKRTDAIHVFMIPRLYSPLWTRMIYKVSDFVFHLSPGSRHWPKSMHELLFIGISLPLISRSPWTLRRTPLLVGLEWKLRQVLSTGEPMDGIFCANFCESRGNLPACRKTWHAECYECLGQGKFPVRTTTDEEGNRWFRQDAREERINKDVRGAHASIPFQCEWVG